MKWFNNLKMIQKLVSAFIIVGLFIGIVGFIGIFNMNNINKDLNSIYNNDLVAVSVIGDIKSNLLETRTYVLLILDPKNKNDVQKNIDAIAVLKPKDDALIVKYKTTIITEIDKQQFAEFEKSLTDYRIVREDLIKQVDEGNYAKANELFTGVSKIRTDMFKVLDNKLKSSTDMAKTNYEASRASYSKSYVEIIVD